MAPRSKSSDRHFGRKNVSLHIEKTVFNLFPQQSDFSTDNDEGICLNQIEDNLSLSEWVSYLCHRTNTPIATSFHALRILRRLARTIRSRPSSRFRSSPPAWPFTSSTLDPSHSLYHHSLVLTALVLATIYSMDDAYSNQSWSIASREYFTLSEINLMEIEVLAALNFEMVSRTNHETLSSLIDEEKAEYDQSLISAQRDYEHSRTEAERKTRKLMRAEENYDDDEEEVDPVMTRTPKLEHWDYSSSSSEEEQFDNSPSRGYASTSSVILPSRPSHGNHSPNGDDLDLDIPVINLDFLDEDEEEDARNHRHHYHGFVREYGRPSPARREKNNRRKEMAKDRARSLYLTDRSSIRKESSTR